MTVFKSEENTKTVLLEKSPKESFGICIVRGEVKDSPSSKVSGLFIKDIITGTPAQRCGKLKVGDRILSINDNDVRFANETTFISYIKSAGLTINLEIQTFDQKKANDTAPSNGYANTNGDINQISKAGGGGGGGVAGAGGADSDDEEDTRDMTGRTRTAAGYEIDRASAGNVKLNNAEKAADKEQEDEFGYTERKIKKRYGTMGEVVRTHVMRPPNSDLGIALAGHKDRHTMASIIAGVNPNGVAKNANMKPGDEVLEVNGNVLMDRCHLNASGVFKKLPTEKVVFILLRRKPSNSPLAVPPVKFFPPIIDETEQLFESYKNCKKIQLQKVGTSIGLMIIEGKHVDIGRGIFISDIQAESSAEQSGLRVGDVILAINKDVIVDSTYDEVVAILKRAQGIVNFVTCNVKTDEELRKEAEKKKQEEEEKQRKREEEQRERERPKDPKTDPIENNKKILIEIAANKKPLGVMVVGGKNNYVTTGCVVTNVYADGACAADKRLQVFDQIIDFNGDPINVAEMSTHKVYQMFHLPYERVTMSVWRNDPPEVDKLNIDVARKPGKDLGLALVGNPKGVMISEIVSAGCADIDSRLQRGDIISKLNGDSLENTPLEVCQAFFRATTGKVSFEVLRPKPTARK